MTDHTIYVGTLRTNEPLINLSGSFETDDIEMAFTLAEDLFRSGNPTINFDCSAVTGVDKGWIERKLREMEHRLPGLKVLIRKHFETPQSLKEAAQTPLRKTGLLDRLAAHFVRLLHIERDMPGLNQQSS